MTTEKQNVGKFGEDLAARYLENHGCKILERNYRKKWGEIDIVASEGDELIFVEVKSQKERWNWRPEENITRHKKHQLSRIISTYLKENKIPEDRDWRIDVVAIELDFENQNAPLESRGPLTGQARVEHIKNILLN